jgi:hypothetical protein
MLSVKHNNKEGGSCPSIHHEDVWQSGGTAPIILKLDTKWKLVVSLMPCPLYSQENETPVPTIQEAKRTSELVWIFWRIIKKKLWPFKHSITLTPSVDHLLRSTPRDQFCNCVCVLRLLTGLVVYTSKSSSALAVGNKQNFKSINKWNLTNSTWPIQPISTSVVSQPVPVIY